MRQSKHGNSLIIAAFHSANKPLFSFQEVKSLSNDMWFPIPKEVLPSGEVKVHRNEMICPTPNSQKLAPKPGTGYVSPATQSSLPSGLNPLSHPGSLHSNFKSFENYKWELSKQDLLKTPHSYYTNSQCLTETSLHTNLLKQSSRPGTECSG